MLLSMIYVSKVSGDMSAEEALFDVCCRSVLHNRYLRAVVALGFVQELLQTRSQGCQPIPSSLLALLSSFPAHTPMFDCILAAI